MNGSTAPSHDGNVGRSMLGKEMSGVGISILGNEILGNSGDSCRTSHETMRPPIHAAPIPRTMAMALSAADRSANLCGFASCLASRSAESEPAAGTRN